MKTKKNRYLVTAALPYANGPIHIGHLAGAYLPADIYVRFLRLLKEDVVFICGTDEHGVPITITAEKEGVSPQVIVDRYHKMIKDAFDKMNIIFDNFSGTSREIHHKTAQEIFLKLYKNGALTVKETEGYYSPQLDMFLPDRYIEGTCPICGSEGARGDQCEKCGSMLNPTQLINPICKVTGEKPILKKTKHFYFKLGDFQKALEEFVAQHEFWKDNVKNYCKNWFKEGLQDRAITRDLNWGIKLPLDDPEFQNKVMYVWFEAPIGYISSTKEWAQKIGEPEKWKDYWLDKDTKIIHFIGKDNIVFHALMFPATLMATKDNWNLVYDIPANEFLNIEGQKISTSRNWAIWVHEYLEELPPDPLRFYLTMIAPETSDSDFTWEGFVKHNNTELADIIGNYVNRLLTFTIKNLGDEIPSKGNLEKEDYAIIEEIKTFYENVYFKELSNRKFRKTLTEYIETFKKLNKYFNDMEPWKLIKTNKERCATVLWTNFKILRDMVVMMYPFMPDTAQTIWELIGEKDKINNEDLNTFLSKEPLSGSKIKLPEKHLFVKFDEKFIEKQKAKLLEKSKQANSSDKQEIDYQPLKSLIDYEDFAKLDLRTGTIIEVEDIKKSKKLYKFTVDLGFEKRTILGGLKPYYKPEELLNKQVIVVANLKPKKMMGMESQGMLLAVNDGEKVKLLMPDSKVNNGMVIS